MNAAYCDSVGWNPWFISLSLIDPTPPFWLHMFFKSMGKWYILFRCLITTVNIGKYFY